VDSARHNRICGIFEQAVSLPETERAALLEQCCAGDAALRAEVESLIAAHQRSNPILDAGALALLTEPDDEEHPDLTGQRIGRYELKRVIAYGGMGIVYEAMQEEPRRIVAVKVLRRLDSASAVRRFREEAQILARLSHPHIAHVYETGTLVENSSRGDAEQLPFFALEYIDGARPLTEFAIERALPIRDRLLLFVKVCEAVQHGHQKGIIHRDLKPANILVDADGVPKVIDFGVARVLDLDGESRTRHTLAGRVIGTLPYCSPEQIDESAGDIDSRSDVYALGTVLYELLSGVPAFKTDGRSTWQTMTMIRESSPQRLRDLDSEFRGNLDAIVSRAMEKNPDRRYQSVESLHRDIGRHLAGEPIEARPQSRWIGATRWMGKHPVLTAASAAFVVTGMISVITLIAIAYGLRQPARFWIADDQSVANLVTVFGRPLATLGGAMYSRVEARIVDRPPKFGSGRIALIIVSSGDHSTDNQLWACSLSNLTNPLWRTTPETPATLPRKPTEWDVDRNEFGYYTTGIQTADVFRESPGEEVIFIRKQRGGAINVVTVSDLSGSTLFEAWHIGNVNAVKWWSDEGLLVCIGERQWLWEVQRHGYVPPPYPKVIYAVRPELHAATGWLNEQGWEPELRSTADAVRHLDWYRALDAGEWTSNYDPARFTSPPGGTLAGKCIGVTFESPSKGAFDLYLDSHGELIRWDWSDACKKWMDEMDLSPPVLTEWPPPAR